jgi:hypothetical protein
VTALSWEEVQDRARYLIPAMNRAYGTRYELEEAEPPTDDIGDFYVFDPADPKATRTAVQHKRACQDGEKEFLRSSLQQKLMGELSDSLRYVNGVFVSIDLAGEINPKQLDSTVEAISALVFNAYFRSYYMDPVFLFHREDLERIAKLPEWIRSIEAFRTEDEPNVFGLGGLTRTPRLDDAEAVTDAFRKAASRYQDGRQGVILLIEPRVPVKSPLYLERIQAEKLDVDNPVGFKGVWLLNHSNREAVLLTGSSLFQQRSGQCQNCGEHGADVLSYGILPRIGAEKPAAVTWLCSECKEAVEFAELLKPIEEFMGGSA